MVLLVLNLKSCEINCITTCVILERCLSFNNGAGKANHLHILQSTFLQFFMRSRYLLTKQNIGNVLIVA